MGDTFYCFMAFLLTLVIAVWSLVFIFGGAEILWWILTGDFFHFVSISAQAASGF